MVSTASRRRPSTTDAPCCSASSSEEPLSPARTPRPAMSRKFRRVVMECLRLFHCQFPPVQPRTMSNIQRVEIRPGQN
ncbi:MAG: hypothetical protein ACK559_10300, partial [bacterium]